MDILRRVGGTATFADLRRVTSARSIRLALADRRIRRLAKGFYALPEQPSPVAVAHAYGGVLSHESAALYWGFQVVARPAVPHVTLGRKRRLRATDLRCQPHWASVPVLDDATTPLRTVIDCARALPFGEALAIADSALRSGKVEPSELLSAAYALGGSGRQRVIRVAELADFRSESALESMLRSRVIEAGFDDFVPQLVIEDDEFHARVDLASAARRIALEAEGFEFHHTRSALRRDCKRHVNLAMRGWQSLRYSWEDVILDETWVGLSLGEVVRGRACRHNPLERAA